MSIFLLYSSRRISTLAVRMLTLSLEQTHHNLNFAWLNLNFSNISRAPHRYRYITQTYIDIYSFACYETNLMHYLSSLYLVTTPVRVSGLLVAHHQEVAMCVCDKWYQLFHNTHISRCMVKKHKIYSFHIKHLSLRQMFNDAMWAKINECNFLSVVQLVL
jgi:hypothetical protein